MKKDKVHNSFIVYKDFDGRCQIRINGTVLPYVKDFSYKKTSAESPIEVMVTFDADALVEVIDEKNFRLNKGKKCKKE